MLNERKSLKNKEPRVVQQQKGTVDKGVKKYGQGSVLCTKVNEMSVL